MRLAKLISLYCAVFGVSALVTANCISVNYSDVPFRCMPSMGANNCPDGYICCSDDPAALDFDEDGDPEGTFLPGYGDHAGKDGYATPIFSGENNNRGSSGMCVREGSVNSDVALTEAEAVGCPIPCNPHWDDDELESVCGEKAACCPTVPLESEDCVLDDRTDCYRPVTGLDIGDQTDWSSKAHATHQDPGGKGCEELDSGKGDKWRACLQRLTVADSRGFCVGLADTPGGEGCPEMVDACEELNAQRDGC